MNDLTPFTLAAIAAAFLAGGFIKGAAGFGMPLTTVSLMSVLVPAPVALGINVLPPLILNIWQLGSPRLIRRVLVVFWPVLPALVLGTVIGGAVAARVDAAILARVLGAVVIGFSLLMLTGYRPPPMPRLHGPLGMMFGTVAGVTGAVATVNGPPLVMYLLAVRTEPELFRAALALFFLVGMACVAIAFSTIGFLTLERALIGAGAAVPAAVGMWLGRKLGARLSVRAFERVILSVFILLGANLLLR